MQIQINTDHNIELHETRRTEVTGIIEHSLIHFSEHITRVEVHLTDENGEKGGSGDKRCVLEARMEGRQPVAVTHEAPTVDQAIHGAAHKLVRMIESTLGRLQAVR